MVRFRWLLAVTVLIAGSCASASDSSNGSSAAPACALVGDDLIQSLIGPAQAQEFELAPLSECTWTSNDGVITLRVETVPDTTLFVEHAVESTHPDRVTRLSGDLAGGVVFADEAVVVTATDVVVMVDGSVPTEQLTPIAAAAKQALEG